MNWLRFNEADDGADCLVDCHVGDLLLHRCVHTQVGACLGDGSGGRGRRGHGVLPFGIDGFEGILVDLSQNRVQVVKSSDEGVCLIAHGSGQDVDIVRTFEKALSLQHLEEGKITTADGSVEGVSDQGYPLRPVQ